MISCYFSLCLNIELRLHDESLHVVRCDTVINYLSFICFCNSHICFQYDAGIILCRAVILRLRSWDQALSSYMHHIVCVEMNSVKLFDAHLPPEISHVTEAVSQRSFYQTRLVNCCCTSARVFNTHAPFALSSNRATLKWEAMWWMGPTTRVPWEPAPLTTTMWVPDGLWSTCLYVWRVCIFLAVNVLVLNNKKEGGGVVKKVFIVKMWPWEREEKVGGGLVIL